MRQNFAAFAAFTAFCSFSDKIQDTGHVCSCPLGPTTAHGVGLYAIGSLASTGGTLVAANHEYDTCFWNGLVMGLADCIN